MQLVPEQGVEDESTRRRATRSLSRTATRCGCCGSTGLPSSTPSRPRGIGRSWPRLDTAAADDDVAVCVLTGRGGRSRPGSTSTRWADPGEAPSSARLRPAPRLSGGIPQAAGGGRERAGGGVRGHIAAALRRGRGRRGRRDPHALHGARNVRRGGKQLAPAPSCRSSAGTWTMLSGSPLSAD